jgi:hypothetical protein
MVRKVLATIEQNSWFMRYGSLRVEIRVRPEGNELIV